MQPTIVLLYYICSIVSLVNCAIEDAAIRNSKGEIEFRVSDENKIKIPNRHRSGEQNAQLKISLHGTQINRVTLLNTTTDSWWLELSDHSNVTFWQEKDLANVTEYYLQWYGGGQNDKREVCFHYGYNGASWYATYQSDHPEWPLNTSRSLAKKAFNSNFGAITKDGGFSLDEVAYIVEHLFVNSDGFAILPDEHLPLFVRRDLNNDDPILCFSVDKIRPYKEDEKDASYLDLNIRLFVSSNIRTVTDYVVHRSEYIPKPTSLPDERKFRYPSWFADLYGQNETETFANDLAKHGFNNVEIYIQDFDNLDLSFPPSSYPDIDTLLSSLKSEAFRISVSISPNLNNAIKHTNSYFLTDKSTGKATSVVDFSYSDAREWYSILLRKLLLEHGIDSYLVYCAFDLKDFNAKDQQVEKYPAQMTKIYLETLAKVANKSVTSTIAYKTQHLPFFVQLLGHSNQKDYIKSIIPNALSISLGGYSLFAPNPIDLNNRAHPVKEEMYIRWLQVSALMPNIALHGRPWDNVNRFTEKATEMTNKFVDLHSRHAQTLIELAKKRMQSGSPIIRPMWYAAPDDPKSYKIADQFMLGDDLLVAPVVDVDKLERTVYLPSGTWLDHHGQSHFGPKEIKIGVPIEDLPLYKRKV